MTEDLWAQEDRLGKCEFVSPLEAYWETIARVRKQKGYEGTADAAENGGSGKAGARFEKSGEVEFEVKGGQEHPVVLLLKQAERKWQALVGREARSLE